MLVFIKYGCTVTFHCVMCSVMMQWTVKRMSSCCSSCRWWSILAVYSVCGLDSPSIDLLISLVYSDSTYIDLSISLVYLNSPYIDLSMSFVNSVCGLDLHSSALSSSLSSSVTSLLCLLPSGFVVAFQFTPWNRRGNDTSDAKQMSADINCHMPANLWLSVKRYERTNIGIFMKSHSRTVVFMQSLHGSG